MSRWPHRILGMMIAFLITSCRTPQQNTPPTHPSITTEQPTEETKPTYALHQPGMEEYLSAIPDIITRIENQHTDDHDIYQLEATILDDLWILYGDRFGTASYDQLIEVAPYLLPHMPPGPFYEGWSHKKLNEEDWHTFVVNAWLRDHQPDLETDSQWTFDHYTLNLDAVDFNGDGINEFSVELIYMTGEYHEYREYFIWQQDKNLPEGYSRPADTSFVFNSEYAFQLTRNWEVFGIEDVTGDGLPEWLVSGGDCGYGICSTWLVIYGWRNGTMQQLTFGDREKPYRFLGSGGGTPSAPPPGTWTFTNLDDDPPLELIQEERFEYPCEFSTTILYDWDDDMMLASTGEKIYDYADSLLCAMRLAHFAMADHDFAAAITHYEKALSFEPVDEVEVEAWQYARLRLAAAYALNGQRAQAASLLSQLEDETATSPIIQDMINNAVSAFAEKQNPQQLCAALYTTILDYTMWDLSVSDIHILTYGQINDYGVPLTYNGGDYGPVRTGCDVNGLWRDTVESLSDDSALNMWEQIEAQGWQVGGEQRADLNQDGVDEWVLWTDHPTGGSVISISEQDKEYYAVLDSNFEPGLSASFVIVDLPEIPFPVLVEISHNPSIPCEMDTLQAPGWIKVWHINTTGLEILARHAICESQTIEETFPMPGELHILSSPDGNPNILYWDAKTGLFLSQSQLQTTPEASPEEDSEPLDCVGSVYGVCISAEEPEKSLQLINAVLSDPPEDATPEFFAAMHYLRASMFEQFGDEEAALAEYVQLYEEAPESAWGMLTRLHLRRF